MMRLGWNLDLRCCRRRAALDQNCLQPTRSGCHQYAHSGLGTLVAYSLVFVSGFAVLVPMLAARAPEPMLPRPLRNVVGSGRLSARWERPTAVSRHAGGTKTAPVWTCSSNKAYSSVLNSDTSNPLAQASALPLSTPDYQTQTLERPSHPVPHY